MWLFFVLSSFIIFILSLQLNGRQPDIFFAAISNAIMTISDCAALVHVLDMEMSSETFTSVLSEHFSSGSVETVQFSSVFTRY
jgi:hypothetical protein